MGITLEEMLQMLGAKDVEIYLLKKQIAAMQSEAMSAKKEPASG